MWLSRLEIFGFKSFAKKLDLKLLGGITAIVGPNGCGKSNVVDAIRWVLGEQRPTKIRLDNMTDVIFKGSNTRRPLGMAEVSLTIENQNGILLPVNLPEITITRRLFRSGESEYLINKTPCRLCDINDMFMDTGMGSDSYSMFEQSMINAVLSDKAEDRRHIFEEAAGITKYKSRRKSAINTLVSIEGDLARLGDIIAELERRVEVLKRQAAKAGKYREFKNELKAKTLAVAGVEIGRQRERLTIAGESLNALESESSAIRATLESLTGETERLVSDIGALEQEQAGLAGQYESVMRASIEHQNEQARIESRLESLEEMIERSRETARRNYIMLDKLAEDHGTRAGEQETIKTRLNEFELAYKSISIRYHHLNGRRREHESAVNALEQELRGIERQIESGSSRVERLTMQRRDGDTRLSALAGQREDIRASLEKTGRELEILVKTRSETDSALEKLTGRKTDLRERHENRMAELGRIGAELNGANERRARFAAELSFFDTLISSFEGCEEGVRAAAAAPCLTGKVKGILADLVSADKEYVPAMEAALADSLQFIVTDSPESARAGADFMDDQPRGRAVFLPCGEILTASPLRMIPECEPVIGPAINFVHADERYLPILSRLLSDVQVVETIETALDLHRKYPGFWFVTISGELVGAAGEIHCGRPSQENEAVSLGRRRKRELLVKNVQESQEIIAALERKRSILEENCAFLKNGLSELETDIAGTRERLAGVTSGVVRLSTQREGFEKNLAGLDKESQTLRTSFDAIERETAEVGNRLKVLKEKQFSLDANYTTLKQEIDGEAGETDKLRDELGKLEVNRAAYREKINALRLELENIGERRESLARSAKRTQEEIERSEAEVLSLGERKQGITESIAGFNDLRQKYECQKAEKAATLSGLRGLRREKDDTLQKLRTRLVDFSNRESALKLEKEEAGLILKSIIQRITDEFFISPAEIPQGAADAGFEPEQEKERLADLRNRLQTFGDINFAAEEEYAKEKERLDFLSNELRDLIEARDILMETISRINHIAVARFRDTFAQIRKNFQQTFHEFFEGGNCGLELAQDEDPLEAAISILAQPPGKNVRSINLLSSGERALTAISLLFSIYMVKPSPFCILDEVDAPLDDANVDRFLRAIAKFSEKTQFIVVTHNKKTMSRAQNLYGITMSEPGLSSLVSVRLSEVNTYEEKATLSAV